MQPRILDLRAIAACAYAAIVALSGLSRRDPRGALGRFDYSRTGPPGGIFINQRVTFEFQRSGGSREISFAQAQFVLEGMRHAAEDPFTNYVEEAEVLVKGEDNLPLAFVFFFSGEESRLPRSGLGSQGNSTSK